MMLRHLYHLVDVPTKCTTDGCSREVGSKEGCQCEVCDLLDSMIENLEFLGDLQTGQDPY